MSQAIAAHLPHSTWVTCSIAEAHYHLRNFDEAQELLEDCRSADPYRLQVHVVYVVCDCVTV